MSGEIEYGKDFVERLKNCNYEVFHQVLDGKDQTSLKIRAIIKHYFPDDAIDWEKNRQHYEDYHKEKVESIIETRKRTA